MLYFIGKLVAHCDVFRQNKIVAVCPTVYEIYNFYETLHKELQIKLCLLELHRQDLNPMLKD
jgi:hypothetical protein